MKKRIFISIPSLNIGGAETALIGMLQTFDYTKVDVDLFMYSHEGLFIPFVPKEVNVLPEAPAYAMIYRGDEKACLKQGLYRLAFRMFMARLRMKLYVLHKRPSNYSAMFSFQGDEFTKALPDINPSDEYDLAMSFVDSHSYVLDHVKAKKTIGWVHTDYTKIDINKKLELPVWRRLDKIIVVSNAVGEAFAKVFPELKDNILTIENILSKSFVKRQADEFFPEEYRQYASDGNVILCSVGRICEAKNYESIPAVAKCLEGMGVRFHWFVVGPGNATDIISNAKALGVGDVVSFIGARENPQPYIKHCTIYVHPSRREGKSLVVREAQVLGKLVVITNFSTAPSHVVDGKDGIIVPMDNDSIAKGIERLLRDKNLQASIMEYLRAHDYGNEEEISKIYELVG